jgi:hypothetical protein
MAVWRLEVPMLKGSPEYNEVSEIPGVKVQGLNDRFPIGAVSSKISQWASGDVLLKENTDGSRLPLIRPSLLRRFRNGESQSLLHPHQVQLSS